MPRAAADIRSVWFRSLDAWINVRALIRIEIGGLVCADELRHDRVLGYTPALAAKEALTRSLSMELAPHGIRVVSLRHAIPETASIREIFNLKAAEDMTWEHWQEARASRTHTRRLTTPAGLANVAAFVASDRASGMTGTAVNCRWAAWMTNAHRREPALQSR
jgi:NAD(P)-dependent dehydrogenase (short-subunit alcohol dehydrogenase family)